MAVTQYIGSRYVPLFADPIDWDITRAYEPLTIVYYQGNSYTSKQAVPTGIDVTNTTYWAITGNYNAQIEQYRNEVQTFDGRITANAQAIADEVTARMSEDTAIRALITTLTNDLETEESARETADTQIRTDFTAADTHLRTDFTAADTQIRTDFAAADTALSGRITTLENRGGYVGIIGDSYSDTAIGSNWVAAFASNIGRSVVNVADNGSGLVRPGSRRGTTFKTQLDEIAANEHFSEMDTIIVYGGFNDRGRTNNEMNTAASEFMSAYRSLASRGRLPRLLFVYGNSGQCNYFGDTVGTFKNYPAWLTNAKKILREQGVPVIEGAEHWLMCMSSNVYQVDHVHPNTDGFAEVGAFMESIYNGAYSGVHRYYNEQIQPADGVTVESYGRAILKFDNGVTQIAFGGLTFDPSQLASTSATLCTNFVNEAYATNYGSGWSANDGLVFVDTPAQRMVYSNNAFQLCKIRVHRYTRAVVPVFQGGYTNIGSFTYDVPLTII